MRDKHRNSGSAYSTFLMLSKQEENGQPIAIVTVVQSNSGLNYIIQAQFAIRKRNSQPTEVDWLWWSPMVT